MNFLENVGKISLERIFVFYTIFKNGSISKSLQELRKTRQAVYHDLNFLENCIEKKLYYSGKKTFILTKDGDLFLQFCKKTIENYSASLNNENLSNNKTITIHTTGGMAHFILPRSAKILQKKYPFLKLKILSAPEYFSAKKYDYDLIIGPYINNRTDLLQIKYRNFEHGFFSSKIYMEKNGAPNTIDDIKSHNLLLYTEDHKLELSTILKAEKAIYSNSYPALLEMCVEGNGIGSFAIIHYDLLTSRCKNRYDNLVRIFPNIISEQYDLYFIFSKHNPDESLFRELLKISKDIDISN